MRDQAARVEKTLGNVQQTIRQNVGRRNRLRSRGVNQENVGRTGEETTRENANMPEPETASNLYSETHNTEEGDEAQKEQTSETNTSGELASSEENSEIIDLVESACIILASIVHPQGDFCERDVDTRIKEKPTNRDIENINKAIENVMEKNKVSEIDQPFVYLWMISNLHTLLILKSLQRFPNVTTLVLGALNLFAGVRTALKLLLRPTRPWA